MAITAGMVKELREMTGAGMMDCKKALSETNGDMDAAVEFLRKNVSVFLLLLIQMLLTTRSKQH